MKLQKIRVGQIFTIGETPSYPKLRIEFGWIDMRDKIIKIQEFAPDDCRVMTDLEVEQKTDVVDVNGWKKEVLSSLAIKDEFCLIN